MDLPVFALHTVLFPGERMRLRVFEERYLAMVDELSPGDALVVVAIRHGREVGGPSEPHRVGVTVAIEDRRVDSDVLLLAVRGHERVALIEPTSSLPYPRWSVEPYPDEGGAGTDDVESARTALERYLHSAGERPAPTMSHDPVSASFAIAAAVPGLVPERQSLLEIAGAGERLARSAEVLAHEERLIRALGAGVGGASHEVNPN